MESEQGLTNLGPDHVRQSADELRRGIPIAPHGLLVDHFSHREPEGGPEALYGGSMPMSDAFSNGCEITRGEKLTSRTSSLEPSAIVNASCQISGAHRLTSWSMRSIYQARAKTRVWRVVL